MLPDPGRAARRLARAAGSSTLRVKRREPSTSERSLQTILNGSCDIIAFLDSGGVVTYVNPAIERVLGVSPASVTGKPFADLIDPRDDAAARLFLDRAEGSNPGDVIQVRLGHRDGSWRCLEIAATGAADSRPRVVNARDVTDRLRMQAQAAHEKQVSGLGRLAGTVAHEFNNVLMGMQPFAELMQRANAPAAMTARGAWHIANSIQRGRRLVLDILRFTQSADPVIAPVDVARWWDTCAPEAAAVLGNTINLVAEIPERGWSVLADAKHLSQIVSNVVVNASEAMPAGGTLTVTASVPASLTVFPFGWIASPHTFVHLALRDTGRGMTSDVMQHAFEPLFTTRRSGGIGLGLTVVHQSVLQHKGHVFLESVPGTGTTVHLFLPRAGEDLA